MLFNRASKKIYFNEEFELNDSELCQILLQTQGIEKSAAQLLLLDNSVMRLVFKGEQLVSKDIGDWGGDWNLEMQNGMEADFRYRDIPVHPVHIIEYAENGPHQLGGKAPAGFQFPLHPDLPVSCQYIGKISGQDPAFAWLPIPELHLAYPLFASVGKLMLDYSEALAPRIIVSEFFDHTFKCVTTQSYIEFEKLGWAVQKLRADPLDREQMITGFGWTGVPFWIQHPEWPRCPRSGRVMKFVAQIDSTPTKAVEKQGIGPENADIQRYLDSLNFWCDGTLYIFMEPETKVACMLIQNT